MPAGAAIWPKFEQPPPVQRSMRYPVTPTSSVAAPQERSIRALVAPCRREGPGALGGWCRSARRGRPPSASPRESRCSPRRWPGRCPVVLTIRSSAMSVSGSVMIRLVQPLPGRAGGPVVMFAPTSRSLALVVVAGPLSDVPAVPDAPATTSTGLLGSIPAVLEDPHVHEDRGLGEDHLHRVHPCRAPLMLAE